MHKKQLNYYTGNYDQYVQTRGEQEENQMKRYKWEQEQISHMKARSAWQSPRTVCTPSPASLSPHVLHAHSAYVHTPMPTWSAPWSAPPCTPPAAEQEYIARFGHGSAKLARQAQSKEKTLDKMVRSGLTERVESDRVVKLKFENVGKLPPPVLQFADVAFGYSPDKVLYR
jgi:ATPase subunit of ABC transporter with duplicated ATPase domains